MAITAQDIHNQSFAIDRKGYDVDEVDVFLEHVADEIDLLNNQIADLTTQLEAARSEAAAPRVEASDVEISEISNGEFANILAEKDATIRDLEDQLADKKANDSAISQALIIAQRSADEIIVKANAQASETMQDAREEADRIISRANADKQGVLDAIRKLEDDREETREGYADLLRDLIEDASNKLNSLGYDDDIDNIPGIGRDAGQLDVVYEEGDPDYIPPTPEGYKPAPAPAVFEKDLSGYGDVEDDFEDVD